MTPIRVETGARVPADDGAALLTDLYRPSDHGRRPVVLLRSYLGKSRHSAEAAAWTQRGFACAVQDVRGRYDSEGDWQPYTRERGDGRATVDWLLAQPWCDGRVAAVGGSYGAFAAWSAAIGHPAVRAVISSVPAMRPMPLQPEDGGILPLLSRVSWWTTHAGARSAREGLAEAMLKHVPEALQGLPVVDLPESLWVDLPGWRDAVLGTESSETQDPILAPELAGLDVAALHLGGWHDPFCAETLRQFELVGSAHDPRPPRALVLGPWWHHLNGSRPARYGERHYGEASKFPLGRYQADWLQHVLGEPEPPKASVRVFLAGENRWLESEHWSRPPVETTTFYPNAGRLDPTPPIEPGQTSIVYDPLNPHPCRRTPLDERTSPARSDVAVFTGAALEEPCRVVGAPRLTLWGSTGARSVDWVARLLEVTADGRRLYLSHGLVDAGRQLAERGERLLPGARHRVEIVLAPLGITLPPGSRLRLEITHSAFPSYARNLGTGESRLTGGQTRGSRQTLFWGSDHPIHLELPVHLWLDSVARCNRLESPTAVGDRP